MDAVARRGHQDAANVDMVRGRGETMPEEIRFEITEVQFKPGPAGQQPLAVVIARFKIGEATTAAKLSLRPLDGGVNWQSVQLWCQDPALLQALPAASIPKMVQFAAKFLTPMTLWFGEQSDEGSPMYMRMGTAPDEAAARVAFSNRQEVLKLAGPTWEQLWDRIEDRVASDIQFNVRGFSADEVALAVGKLRHVFPADWVRARYKRAGALRMGDPLPQTADGWFPAFLLARTALGSLCVDPGWNYLVELGLALEELGNFDELPRLRAQLTRSNGSQHHLCMAAEMHRRELLQGLEPQAGAGAAKNDLLVSLEGASCQIEVKEFSSITPSKALARELRTKQRELPEAPATPTIFHVVLTETRDLEKEREKEFCDRIGSLAIPPSISAVVVGRRFVDSVGGRVKRDVVGTILNPNAVRPITQANVDTLFRANYDAIAFPIHALGSTMVVGPNDDALKISDAAP